MVTQSLSNKASRRKRMMRGKKRAQTGRGAHAHVNVSGSEIIINWKKNPRETKTEA